MHSLTGAATALCLVCATAPDAVAAGQSMTLVSKRIPERSVCVTRAHKLGYIKLFVDDLQRAIDDRLVDAKTARWYWQEMTTLVQQVSSGETDSKGDYPCGYIDVLFNGAPWRRDMR